MRDNTRPLEAAAKGHRTSLICFCWPVFLPSHIRIWLVTGDLRDACTPHPQSKHDQTELLHLSSCETLSRGALVATERRGSRTTDRAPTRAPSLPRSAHHLCSRAIALLDGTSLNLSTLTGYLIFCESDTAVFPQSMKNVPPTTWETEKFSWKQPSHLSFPPPSQIFWNFLPDFLLSRLQNRNESD